MNDRTPVPMYYQVEQDLRRRIEAGEWGTGDLLPAERELVERYSISRMTVRQALSRLVSAGLVRRERGRGTFVASPKIHMQLSSLKSFSEEMALRGKRARAQVLHLAMEPAAGRVADSLGVDPGHPVAVVERLRLADDEPVGIERSHLSFQDCASVLHEDLSGSLYRLLREKYEMVPARAEERIEAGGCPSRAAHVLGIRRGYPVLLITRTTRTHDDRRFEFVESVYRGDQYAFHVQLALEPDTLAGDLGSVTIAAGE